MSWTKICAAADIAANSFKKFNANGIDVIVANVGGEFRAYPPLCPHMAEPLETSGVCDGKVLTCTKHLWQWDMLSGDMMGMAERELLLYPIKQDGDAILVNLEKELAYNYDD